MRLGVTLHVMEDKESYLMPDFVVTTSTKKLIQTRKRLVYNEISYATTFQTLFCM